MPIRLLPEPLANRIAAGEVVERPASVVKELVENAIDAGAGTVEIELRDGGKALIRVADDGHGMGADELLLAVERHATSKLPDDDLLAIRFLGFRGEALPSIGSVARLTITSRLADEDAAATLSVLNGHKGEVRPAALKAGTRVEVEDLFAAVPARLKFLKSTRAEELAATETVRRLAAAHPRIDLTLTLDGRKIRFPAQPAGPAGFKARLTDVLGRDFADNAVPVDAAREGFRIAGFAAVPTWHRATAQHQLLIVNGRPVRDRLLIGALRAAYGDLIPRDRHPAVALALTVDPREVDVNVHPAKAEVRFRDGGLPRALLISALRSALQIAGPQVATTGQAVATAAFRSPFPHPIGTAGRPSAPLRFGAPLAGDGRGAAPAGFGEDGQTAFALPPSADARADAAPVDPDLLDRPLGAAKAQLHDTYILAQTRDGIVLVDMHAAHERLVLEALKQRRDGPAPSQALLVPEVVEMAADQAALVVAAADELAGLGLAVEPFGPGAVLIRETPAALGTTDARALVQDIADGLAEWGEALPLAERLDRLAGTFACHHSIRAGRRLKPDEMNALLRQIEAEPAAAQCNHGRPTYVTLARADLERLFERR
ncbi:MAG TPA: DNA mismatch repair endonuclease MutL [Hyphomicrobiales bacterium]|nr:DNA mismatch repair endonuclease MutL [Hyphomicrobiales bacterium]